MSKDRAICSLAEANLRGTKRGSHTMIPAHRESVSLRPAQAYPVEVQPMAARQNLS